METLTRCCAPAPVGSRLQTEPLGVRAATPTSSVMPSNSASSAIPGGCCGRGMRSRTRFAPGRKIRFRFRRLDLQGKFGRQDRKPAFDACEFTLVLGKCGLQFFDAPQSYALLPTKIDERCGSPIMHL